MRRMLDALHSVFACVLPMIAYVPLYGTQWALAIASNSLTVTDFNALATNPSSTALQGVRHYSPTRHATLFVIPPEFNAPSSATSGPIGALMPAARRVAG